MIGELLSQVQIVQIGCIQSSILSNKTIYPTDRFKCNKFLLESRFGDRGYYYNLRERTGCRLYNAIHEFRYIYV